MSTALTNALKSEISRLARKEIKAATAPLQKAVIRLRRDNAALKRQNQNLEAQLKRLGKATPTAKAAAVPSAKDVRFSPGLLKKLRKRLGVSMANLAKILGVSINTIMNWESGKTRPRAAGLKKISSARQLSPAAALKLVGKGRKKAKR